MAVGDRAEYTCFPGYKMEGSKYLTCTSSGEWNQAKPKCVCKYLNSLRNIALSAQLSGLWASKRYTHGLLVFYCALQTKSLESKWIFWLGKEYKMFNVSVRVKESGQVLMFTHFGFLILLLLFFFQTVPSCDPPKLPENSEIRGSTKSSFKYSDKVFLKCKTGYFTIGIGLLTCGSDGWTSRSFSCSRMFNTCLTFQT